MIPNKINPIKKFFINLLESSIIIIAIIIPILIQIIKYLGIPILIIIAIIKFFH